MEISIRDILAKHPVPGVREAQIRHSVAKAITELTGVDVKPEQVKHTEGRLALTVPPVLKSALLLKLTEFKEQLKKEGVAISEVR